MADLNVSIFDSVSVQEDISSFWDLIPSVFDVIAVQEDISSSWDPLAPSVVDSVGLSEVLSIDYTSFIIVNDAVVITEGGEGIDVYAPISFEMSRKRGKRWRLNLPVWELDASFHDVFYCGENLKMPGRSILGYCGAILEERLPTWSLDSSSEVSQEYGSDLGKSIPTREFAGNFGGMLNETIAVRTAELEFEFSDVFILDAGISPRSLEASFLYPDLMTLSRLIPIWQDFDGNLALTEMGSSLNVVIPFHMFSGVWSLVDYMELEKRMPVWRLESDMFTFVFDLSSNIPVWLIHAVGDTTVLEESRFSDYVLRYIRP